MNRKGGLLPGMKFLVPLGALSALVVLKFGNESASWRMKMRRWFTKNRHCALCTMQWALC